VEYYSRLASAGEAGAPRYRKISGVGTVDEVRARAFAALAT
jgi:adenylate kinase